MLKSLSCPLLACLLFPGCSKPSLPDHDDRPEPQASASPTRLREAMQHPVDKARTAQDEIDAAAGRQRDAIDAATGD